MPVKFVLYKKQRPGPEWDYLFAEDQISSFSYYQTVLFAEQHYILKYKHRIVVK